MRAFLGIPLPVDLLEAAAAIAPSLMRDTGDWRLARGEGLHLTLRFLGEVDPDCVRALETPVAAAARDTPALELAVRGAGAFPSVRRPRLLWLGIDERRPGGALPALAARLEEAAREAGLAPESRPFFPHVTLARAKGDRAGVRDLEAVGTLGTFVASEAVLFRSLLGRGGSRYEVVRQYALLGAR